MDSDYLHFTLLFKIIIKKKIRPLNLSHPWFFPLCTDMA